MKEWDGPVAVAVYIEFQSGTDTAASCENDVMQYMKEAVSEMWTDLDSAPPVSVSFLYTTYEIPGAACDLKLSGGDATGGDATASQGGQTEYGSPSIPRRLYNRFQRNLLEAWRQGDSSWQTSDSIPQKGSTPTPVKSVWHFRAKGGTRLMVSSRPWKQVYDEFYPVNALRNLAWEQVWLPNSVKF